MDISIVICTRDNAARLRQTLVNLSRCRIPPGITWEVVLVNHNSQDDTETVAREMQSSLPLTYVVESRTGLSYARNRSLAAPSGALIVFTDDDVEPDPAWIETYWTAYTTAPTGRFWGGPIESEFEAGEPDWDLVRLGPPSVKGLDLGGECRKTPGNAPAFVGSNWASPRAAVMKAGGFDLTLGFGAEGQKTIAAEETDLMCKLLLAGMESWYLPAAKIRHFVPKAKVSLRHIATRYRAWGRYEARDLPMLRVVPLLGIPRWIIRRLLTDLATWLFARITARSGIAAYLDLQKVLGVAEGFRPRYLHRDRETANTARG